MPELAYENVADVIQACNASSGEAAEIFGRALGLADAKVTVGEAESLQTRSLPEGFDGPGLVVVLTVNEMAALLLISKRSGLLLDWCEEPDPTGQSKLQTLAQELGMTLLPEQFMPTDFAVGWVKTLAGAIARGGVEDGAAVVPLELCGQNQSGTAMLVWPATKPAAVLGAMGSGAKNENSADGVIVAELSAEADRTPPSHSQPKSNAGQKPMPTSHHMAGRHAYQMGDLPDYSRSLLKVEVPVIVTLAEKRQPLGKIVELGPGSIIHFDKSCEEMLELDVGGRHIATGEAVKVGDKFGLRITSMVLPEERFVPVGSAG